MRTYMVTGDYDCFVDGDASGNEEFTHYVSVADKAQPEDAAKKVRAKLLKEKQFSWKYKDDDGKQCTAKQTIANIDIEEIQRVANNVY